MGKWSNPGRGEVPSPTPWCIEKGALELPSTTVGRLAYNLDASDILIY